MIILDDISKYTYMILNELIEHWDIHEMVISVISVSLVGLIVQIYPFDSLVQIQYKLLFLSNKNLKLE